ncbi:hypothetical protein AB0B30_37220 [Streptomyces narbonensis]|uniref:Uncharacterized protein n=1 Tax=Streptomyces narbonensis TaxID=67333 RepID=A0ABV3CLR7_9ACTN
MSEASYEATCTRALVSAYAHSGGVLLLPVLVPADAEAPAIHPLTVLLLGELQRLTAERDAFKTWVTHDPTPPRDTVLRARAADAAGNLARRDSP